MRSSSSKRIALLCALGFTGTAASSRAQTTTAPTAGFPGQWAPPPAEWKYPVFPRGCQRFEGPERAECLDFVASDFGRLARYAAANAALGAPGAGEARVVFFGDSITDGWSRPGNGGFFPGKPYVNRGIGGQTTAQMLVRFRADVLELGPKVVVILAGTNDLAGNAGPVSPEELQDNWTTLAELAHLYRIRVVLASILPVADDKTDANGAPLLRSRNKSPETLRALNRWLRDYCRDKGHVYLDYYTSLSDAAGSFLPALNDDGLHPNAKGYAVMAPLAEKAVAEALQSR